MLDDSRMVSIVRAYLSTGAGRAIVGLQVGTRPVPDYHVGGKPLPPICETANEEPAIRQACSAFYRDLPNGLGEVTCPFGIVIRFSRVERTFGGLTAAVVLGVSEQARGLTALADLPRVAKKKAQSGIVNTREMTFHPVRDSSVIDDFADAIRLLVGGRVSDAIRALAHQMLTPVQGARADRAELAAGQDGASGEVLDRLGRNLESVAGLAERIKLLLTGDLTYLPQSIRKVTVHKVVHNIIRRLESAAHERHIQIRNNFNSGVLYVEAVPDLLEAALSCLIENAVKYSFDGSDKGPREVDIRYRDEDDCLSIAVTNYGCCITSDEIASGLIFQLGYRGINSRDRNRDGTGSGLYIAQKIVDAHGGRIIVSSRSLGEDRIPICRNEFRVRWPIHSR